MFKAVIFDLNGVILIGEYLTLRFNKRFGIPEDNFFPVLKEIMGVVRQPHSPPAFSLWKPYLQNWHIDLSEPEFFDFWFSDEKPLPGFIEYLGQLQKSDIKVFILSNNFKERTDYYRQHYPQIFSSVDKAYFSWETGHVKPSPESLKLLLSENNLRPQDCIYFDDSTANLEMAQKLGINSFKWIDLPSAKKIIEN